MEWSQNAQCVLTSFTLYPAQCPFQTAFTRTLTTLYSTTLLCLLTTLQLTLLARSKYVSSVLQLEREERFRDRLQFELSISNILLSGGKELESLMTGNISSIMGDSEDTGDINEDSESKYLTLSWWLLHVGWKDVGERVRRGVEEVFCGYIFSFPFTYSILTHFTAFLWRLNSQRSTFID